MFEKWRIHTSWKTFFKDLRREINDDNVFNGAAALAYYLTLSVFPAMIVLLAAIPYLPIPNLESEIMNMLHQAMPGEAATMFTDVVRQITTNREGGLFSVGILLTLWAASNGMNAVMQHLNITYDVKEERPFWKVRGTAMLLTFLFGVLIVGAFSMVIFGGKAIDWAAGMFSLGSVAQTAIEIARWTIVAAAMCLGFALAYYLGPDVDQKFKYITPGSVFAVLTLVGASLLLKFYVENFGKYSATYGSIGAVIVFMLWLYVMGLVTLLGSEVNALIEHYLPEGKNKGEKVEGRQAA